MAQRLLREVTAEKNQPLGASHCFGALFRGKTSSSRSGGVRWRKREPSSVGRASARLLELYTPVPWIVKQFRV